MQIVYGFIGFALCAGIVLARMTAHWITREEAKHPFESLFSTMTRESFAVIFSLVVYGAVYLAFMSTYADARLYWGLWPAILDGFRLCLIVNLLSVAFWMILPGAARYAREQLRHLKNMAEVDEEFEREFNHR